MDNLRWILLLIGLGVIFAVYALTRYQIRRREAAGKPGRFTETARPAPGSGAMENDAAAVEAELARMESLLREEKRPAAAANTNTSRQEQDAEQLIVLSVMATAGEPFTGPALLRAFENTALQFSDRLIFQRVSETGAAVYGVASAVKPGTFEPERMEQFTTPGLSLFLQLPGPVDGIMAFDDMLTTAERLAVELGGELQDQHHSVLSRQTVAHLREGIINARLRSARAAP